MSEVKRPFARIAAILALVSMALSGCATASGSGFSSQPHGVRLNAPTDGALASPVWMPDGYLYFIFLPSYVVPGKTLTDSLWRVRPGDKAQQVQWKPSGVCPLAVYGSLTRLPDGRLGLDRTCRPGGTTLQFDDLVALDTKTLVESVLARFPELPAINLYAWQPGLASGFVSDETGECAAIWPVAHDALGRFSEPVTIDGHSWRLDQGMGQALHKGLGTCTRYGKATAPIVMADGELMFVASGAVQGVSDGITREDAPWELYRWDLAGQPRKIIGDIGHLTGYALSPDQRTVAIGGDIRGTLGLWLVDLAIGRARQVGGANVECVDPAFNASGTKVVCSWQRNLNDGELWMINASSGAR
jgi:hypothetical protein